MKDEQKYAGRKAECCVCHAVVPLYDAMRFWWRGQGKFWCSKCVKKA